MKCGITEAGDAGLDFSWVNKLLNVNVIISKHLTVENHNFIKYLIENSHKIILHCTCTGYGGTLIEPNVPSPFEVYDGVVSLIKKGFPVSQIVLRTDPIIPTNKGIARVKKIWDLFSDTGIERCRYSIIDMYPHVRERILNTYGTLPFEGFKAPDRMIENVKNTILNYKGYTFESCTEDLPEQLGCISYKDFSILGVPFNEETGGFQRKGCLCVAGKTELLNVKKQCASKCIYCYWKDK